ncbi:MAG: beta-galactosidase, partial [Victivallales bacterium]|nr:beta-galactosidase [Victivallales bacterium]
MRKAILALLLATVSFLSAQEWHFNNTAAGWTTPYRATHTLSPDGIVINVTGPNFRFMIETCDFDPKDTEYMEITYTANKFPANSGGQLFFGTKAVQKLNEDAKFYVRLLADGEEHTTYIPLNVGKAGDLWKNAERITCIRLDPINQFPGILIVRSIRLVNAKEYAAAKQKKLGALGVPFSIPVTLPKEGATVSIPSHYDKYAPHYSSPMAAPQGHFNTPGVHFIRIEFDCQVLPVKTFLQCMCDDAVRNAYLNGHKIDASWSKEWAMPTVMQLPPADFRVGKNVIAFEYNNDSSIGGIMMDLQLLDGDGTFQVVTTEKAKGVAASAPDGWYNVDYKCDWPTVDTRPGPPHAPWSACNPVYQSIRQKRGTAVINVVKLDGATADITIKGEPPLADDDKVFVRLYTQKGNIIDFRSGTVKELQGKRNKDASVSFHFDGFKLPKYGSAMDGNWEFGVYDRAVEGVTKQPFHLPDRVMPGSPAVMTIAKTPQGPVPMLNGKPFFFNMLTFQHFNAPNGVEGPNSPFNVVMVRVGGYGDSGRWWVGPDQYDFTTVDANLSMLAERFPDSMLALHVWCHPDPWYEKTYPERISQQEDGKTVAYYMATVSFSNPDYQADARRAVATLVAHCEKYFGPKMVLYDLMGGATCEWQGWNSHTPHFADYNPHSLNDFQAYAREHGTTVAAIPSPEARTRSDGGLFRNPVTDKDAILYDRFYNDAMADCIDGIAEAIKKTCNNTKLVGCYYGYHMEYGNLDYCVNCGGHNATWRLVESPYMDFFLSPQSYGVRGLGAPNADMKPYGTFINNGKFSIIEDDTRTCLLPKTGHEQTLNMPLTLNVLRRNIGMSLARRQPLMQLPLVGGNELNDPQIREVFSRSLQVGQYLMENGTAPVAQIAAVIDERALQLLASSRAKQVVCPQTDCFRYSQDSGQLLDSYRGVQPLTGDLLYYQRYQLARIGAPVDVLLLEDVVRNANKYKVVIFLNSFTDTAALHAAFDALRRNNVKIVVTYGAGFIVDNGLSVNAMNTLTGLHFKQIDNGSLKVSFDGKGATGDNYPVNPSFTIPDEDAVVYGKYM